MPRDTNPRGLSDEALGVCLKEDLCPMCLGELDTGWECNSCGFDAMPLVKEQGASSPRQGETKRKRFFLRGI